MPSPRRARLRLAVAGSAVALVAGCGTVLPGAATGAGQTGQTGQTGQAEPGAPDAGSGSSLCSLFSPAELKTLIGISPAGEPLPSEFGGRSCQWQDVNTTGTTGMLSVEVGDPGSAPGGQLQPFKPEYEMQALPDGMARDMIGRVYFVCGQGSECRVQITKGGIDLSGTAVDKDVEAGVALVPTVRSKVGG